LSFRFKNRRIIQEIETNLNAVANLRGLTGIMGRKRKATKKHTAAPTRHPMNPSNLFYPSIVPSLHGPVLSVLMSKMVAGNINTTFPTETARDTLRLHCSAHYSVTGRTMTSSCRSAKMDYYQPVVLVPAENHRCCSAPNEIGTEMHGNSVQRTFCAPGSTNACHKRSCAGLGTGDGRKAYVSCSARR
jgi:hypothetical protein